jgi:hypothetical protein
MSQDTLKTHAPLPGDIPADFVYRSEPSQPIRLTPRRRPGKEVTPAPSWGLWSLGYQPAKVSSWLSTAESWQPVGTQAGHPYFTVHKPDRYPPTPWPLQLTVVVPTHTMDRHLEYQDADLHRRAQPSTPIHGHPNWVDVTSGKTVDRSERSHLTVPGVPVYTVTVHSNEELRDVLSVHDQIMRSSPETYTLQAALQRRTE